MRLRQVLRKRCGKPWPAPTTPAINVLPSRVTAAQTKASGVTAQWTAFKSRLDTQLNAVVENSYEGSAIPWVQDYALGYQCLKGSDPTTAAKYADKAVAILWTSCQDLVRSIGQNRQFLAQGDGTTTTFTLPNTPMAGTFSVYRVPIGTSPMTRGGTPNGQDSTTTWTDYTAIKIVSTNDVTAPAAYIKGTDWQQSGAYSDSTVDWSLAGSEPTAGTTYYVVHGTGNGAAKLTTGFTQSGTTLTLTTPPTTSQALFVEYLYTDANGNNYRQTGCGFGGFNLMLIDGPGFPGRYIRYLATAYDWLYGYAGFPSDLKALVVSLLKQWQTYYYSTAFGPLNAGAYANNYTIGYYTAQLFSALALNGRDSAAATLLSQIVSWHSSYLQPGLTGGAQTLQGGQWGDGWNYGPLAIESYLVAAAAYNDSGNGTFSTDSSWAVDLLNCLTVERPTATSMITMGCYSFPEPFPPPTAASPNSNFVSLAAYLSTDAAKAAWGNYMLQNQYSAITVDSTDLLFRDPAATATDYTPSRPLAAYIVGTLTWLSRADNTDTGTFVWCDLGNVVGSGHYSTPFQTGHIGIDRASDLLVYNGNDPGGAAGVNGNQSTYANVVMCDDAGSGYQTYDIATNGGVPRMGFIAGSGPFAAGYRATGYGGLDVAGSGYAYAATQDLPLTYVDSSSGRHTCQHFQRRVLHVRPDYVLVHDRIQLSLATFTCWQQWHSHGTNLSTTLDHGSISSSTTTTITDSSRPGTNPGWTTNQFAGFTVVEFNPNTGAAIAGQSAVVASNTNNTLTFPAMPLAPTVGHAYALFDPAVFSLSGNTWTLLQGSSKLFGACYSSQGLTTSSSNLLVNGEGIKQLKHTLTTGTTTAFTFMTAMQSAPSATGAMDATTYLSSGDARFDGVLIGTVLALFPQADDVNPWSGTTSYSATYSSTITHYICGVQPNRTFTVAVSVGSGPGTATSSAGGVLTFQTTGTGASQTITLS